MEDSEDEPVIVDTDIAEKTTANDTVLVLVGDSLASKVGMKGIVEENVAVNDLLDAKVKAELRVPVILEDVVDGGEFVSVGDCEIDAITVDVETEDTEIETAVAVLVPV